MKNFKFISVLFLAITMAFTATAQRQLQHTVVLEFDATGGKAIGTYDLNTLDKKTFKMPDNARITRAYYEVQTLFASALDTAIISIGIPTDDAAGIEAAVALEVAGDNWDVGLHECIQTGTMATAGEKTTAATRKIRVTVSQEALTAGKFVLVIEYVILE